MKLQELKFESHEEKLAEAYRHIDMLWRTMLALKTRIDIDTLAIGALVNTHDDPEALRESWCQLCSRWMAEEWPASVAKQGMEQATEELGRRTTFWTSLFDARAGRRY